MNIAIFGLSISSSWGNGHATIWRGLCKGLCGRGHRVTFFEKDVPYYAQSRDYAGIEGVELVLYQTWDTIARKAENALSQADVAIVTSYCPDAIAASEMIVNREDILKCFYDLDAPVTLTRLENGENVEYIPQRGLRDFDLVLSWTGGETINKLKSELGAQEVWPLYGCVDPDIHRPVEPKIVYNCDLSYLGTYSPDRQDKVNELLVKTARYAKDMRFIIGGSQYPNDFPWQDNIWYLSHVEPPQHPAFYCSSNFTLNITRRAMAEMGFCPQGRLFEAGACGTAIISDYWEGLEQFYEPGEEIIICRTCEEVLDALSMTDSNRKRIAEAARQRTLECHTATRRAQELENIFDVYLLGVK